MPITLVCEQCGKTFSIRISHSIGRKCCSRECDTKRRLSINGSEITCRTCGKVFRVPNWQKGTRKFCSDQCAGIDRNTLSIFCEHCGKEFSAPASTKGKTKFCSQACHYAHTREKRPEITCRTCGKIFTVPPIREKTARYCSIACADPKRGPKADLTPVVCKFCGSTFFEHKSHVGRRVYCSSECKKTSDRYYQKLINLEKVQLAKNITGKDTNYYTSIKVGKHPFAHKDNGHILTHRYLIECWLKENDTKSKYLVDVNGEKYLSQDIIVHHRNGVKVDNRIENLQIMTQAEHAAFHAIERKEVKSIELS